MQCYLPHDLKERDRRNIELSKNEEKYKDIATKTRFNNSYVQI